jgi:integral membrane protein (TIGR01906 family)
MKLSPASLLTGLVTLLTPLTLLMLGVRLLLTPLFPAIEYQMPGFPPDSYGFSQQDRLTWAQPSILYLVNDQPLSYLADLRLADGSPLYNERELSHMQDVKNVVQTLLRVWYLHLAGLMGLALWAGRTGQKQAILRGLSQGGFLTVALLLGLGAFAAISFWEFFAWFHSLFFAGDTWLFSYSDSLIRLFPLRFWQDAVLYLVGFALLSGLALGWGMKQSVKY